MPIGGKLVLKGGATLGGGGGGVDKKKTKKKKAAAAAGSDAAAAAAAGGAGTSASAAAASAAASGPPQKEELPKDKLPNAYEKAFVIEARRLQQGQERANPWGASYRPPPAGAILHGRSVAINGDTAEERLDLRSAAKADRYCK